MIEPSPRKPLGVLAILAYIALWCVIVASASGPIGALPALAQLVIYLIAGIIWIYPLKPMLRWIETGRWE